MKPLKSLINKKNIKTVSASWPNPYHITEKDQINHLKDVPIEIINLILHEYISQRKDVKKENALSNMQLIAIDFLFSWDDSPEGWPFWADICQGKFDIFYQTYDKTSLSKRLGEKW